MTDRQISPPERPGTETLANASAQLHYLGEVGPIEHADLSETEMALENIGWTLGNDCPYRCTHCYSMSARRKGMNLQSWMIDRIVDQLVRLGVKTVNLGGNEPIYTNGMNVKRTLLPYIIERLQESRIAVGLTTSGISLTELAAHHPDSLRRLNDIDVSLDSPFAEQHDANRGARLFGLAIEALEICQKFRIDHTIIMCAMKWNFTATQIDRVLDLARRYDAHIRINPLKPVQEEHMESQLDARAFYKGFSRLMAGCRQIDLGEPLLAAAAQHVGKGCPCGRTSFRIHSITPDGTVPVSPCVYLHDYKCGDLLTDDIMDIVCSPQFRSFRRRNSNPASIPGCQGCRHLETCRGGCAARSYLHNLHEHGLRSLFVKDPYCLQEQEVEMGSDFPAFPQRPNVPSDKLLVHRDYLCTWIGEPRHQN